MQPAQQPAQNNDQLLQAIQALRTDLTADIDKRFQEQQSTFEERLKPVESIQETLDKARQQQEEALQRQQQQQQGAYKPQTWEQIRQDAANDAITKFRQEQEAKEAEERRTHELTAQEEAELERDIDNQLANLEKNGYLPRVGNPNDYNDPGVATRRELLAAAEYMGSPELDKVAVTLAQMHRSNMVFDPQTKTYRDATGTTTPLPGKFAPVGNSSTNSVSSFTGPTARELHSMSMDELVNLAQVRGYGPVPTSTDNTTPF